MKVIHVFNHEDYHRAIHGQLGHGMPVFSGSRQKGAGLGAILGYIGRYALPIFSKYIAPHAKAALMNTLSDVVEGRPVLPSIRANSLSMVKNVGKNVLNSQSGGGLPFKARARPVSIQKLDQPHRVTKHKSSNKKAPKKGHKISKIDIFG
jgi:hypothetical protein